MGTQAMRDPNMMSELMQSLNDPEIMEAVSTQSYTHEYACV